MSKRIVIKMESGFVTEVTGLPDDYDFEVIDESLLEIHSGSHDFTTEEGKNFFLTQRQLSDGDRVTDHEGIEYTIDWICDCEGGLHHSWLATPVGDK